MLGLPNSALLSHKFVSSSYDFTLFIQGSNVGLILLLLYVDDMVISGDDIVGIRDLQQFLSQQFEMKDLGSLGFFLGLEVSSDSDGYYLSQATYASDLLSRAELSDCKIVDNPLDTNVKLRTMMVSDKR